ncbi:hypothetical protein ABFZ85_14915 [Hyphococcus formosus]|uniref:lipoyl protein ligase domain-containing protein n=1 Tax=Hyphococcus formosus TaxID=3143534 RepID=UPI00398B2C91
MLDVVSGGVERTDKGRAHRAGLEHLTDHKTPQENIELDDRLFEAAIVGEITKFARIWTNQQCLVVPANWRKKSKFVEASTLSCERGWPVCTRSSGGSCVPHGEGVVNLSLLRVTKAKEFTPHDAYTEICGIIIQVLQRHHICGSTGFVPDSFCDGAYNVSVKGKKYAGTAQRRRALTERTISLAHASIFLSPPPEAIPAVQQFLSDLGENETVRSETHHWIGENRDRFRISEEVFCKTLTAHLRANNWPD